jgi:hypothetical protein
MKHLLLILILIISLKTTSSGQGSNKSDRNLYLDKFLDVNEKNVPTDKKMYYYPVEVFKDKTMFKGHDTLVISKYSKPLFACKEPLLYNKNDYGDAFRFLWLRTSLNPLVISIMKNGDEYKVQWKISDGLSETDPGVLILDQSKEIDKETWDKFMKLLNKAKYWEMETNEKKIVEAGGSRWILEGAYEDKYHIVDRWSPESGSYYECCKFLIKLTDLKINNSNIF